MPVSDSKLTTSKPKLNVWVFFFFFLKKKKILELFKSPKDLPSRHYSEKNWDWLFVTGNCEGFQRADQTIARVIYIQVRMVVLRHTPAGCLLSVSLAELQIIIKASCLSFFPASRQELLGTVHFDIATALHWQAGYFGAQTRAHTLVRAQRRRVMRCG